MYEDKGSGQHKRNKTETEDTKHKAGTKAIITPKAEYEDAKNGNITAKLKKLGKEDITESPRSTRSGPRTRKRPSRSPIRVKD